MSNHHYTLLGENNLRKEKAKKQSYRNWHKNCLFWLIEDSYDSRSSRSEEFIKKVFLKILPNSQENSCARASFLIKLQAWACNSIKKEALAQVLSCEFCKIPKNIFSYRTSLVLSVTHYCLMNIEEKPKVRSNLTVKKPFV